jgi:hypothetical protein
VYVDRGQARDLVLAMVAKSSFSFAYMKGFCSGGHNGLSRKIGKRYSFQW